MISMEIAYRQQGDRLSANGSGDDIEAAAVATMGCCPVDAMDGASELEMLRLEINGLDLTGSTRHAEDAALAGLASFVEFASPAAMEAAIRRFQEAREALLAYEAKAAAILARCEEHWGWVGLGEAREE